MKMELFEHYPLQIKNKFGIIIGVKLIPSGLPKEGPGPLQAIGYPAILMACNLWSNGEAEDHRHWDWYYCPVEEVSRRMDAYVREHALNFNQWYYLDVFDFDGEFHD